MNLEIYKDELEKHDWFYHFSDDGRVFSKGDDNHKRLMQIAESQGMDFKKEFNEAHAKRFHRDPFEKPWNMPFKEAK